MKTGFGDNDPDEEDSEEDQSDKDDNEPAAKKGRLEAEKAPTLNPDVTDLDHEDDNDSDEDQSNKYDDVATTMSKKKKTHPNKSLGKYLFLFSRPPIGCLARPRDARIVFLTTSTYVPTPRATSLWLGNLVEIG